MIDLTFPYRDVNVQALTAALRGALGEAISGISTSLNDGIRVHFFEAITVDQRDTASQIVQAHDPVWLMANKTGIVANGVDEVTITVRAAAVGAPDIWLNVESDDDLYSNKIAFDDQAEQLIQVSSIDPQWIIVSVDTPNRCQDRIMVRAS